MSAPDKERRDARSGVVRSSRAAARLWWALLPYAGCYGWGKDDGGNWRWWMRFNVVPYLLWKLVAKLPSSSPFEPMEPIVCTCDYCRGVPGAVFEA